MGFIAPAFADYDKHLAKAMTHWLYADPATNPSWNDESRWANGPRVQYVKRTLAFEGLDAAATPQNVTLDQLFGGKNALIFSKMATVVDADAQTLEQLPNTRSGMVTYRQQKAEGYYEIETTSVNNVFGTTPGQPWMYPLPKFWYGPDARNFQCVNLGADAVNATFTFLAAVLDTGR